MSSPTFRAPIPTPVSSLIGGHLERLGPRHRRELHARQRRRAQRRRPRIRAGQGLGDRPARQQGRRAAVVLRHAARRHASTTRATQQRRQRSEQSRRPRASCCSRRRTRLAITLAVDYTRQRPEGYTQVVAGVAPTLRPANRQYPQIAADLGYTPPSFNAFDRRDRRRYAAALVSGSRRLVAERRLEGRAAAALTSTTALALLELESVERPRLHRPADHHGLGGAVDAAAVDAGGPLRRRPLAARELRRRRVRVPPDASTRTRRSSRNRARPPRASCSRRAPTRRRRACSTATASTSSSTFGNTSAAVFGQVEWAVTDRLRLLPGLRFNYDQKDVDFDQQVYGGLQTTNPALIALQRSILAPQAYTADVDDTNLSGQLTAAYKVAERVNAYATYATGFKSVGLNLNGVPTDAPDQPVLSRRDRASRRTCATSRSGSRPSRSAASPRTSPPTTPRSRTSRRRSSTPASACCAAISPTPRRCACAASSSTAARACSRNLSFYGAAAYTDGRYISFPDAPPPLEDTGGPQVKDISGSVLPGISKWAFSLGGEYARPQTLLGQRRAVLRRASTPAIAPSFSSSASASRYLVVDGYSLVNARVGFRSADGWTLFALVAQSARTRTTSSC